jgi:polysaccharide pyruvyl transferase CsaB
MAGGYRGVKRRFDVTICGYYGFGNLGDELIARGLVHLLIKNGIPADRIAVLSASGSIEGGEGTVLVPRWDPARVLKTLGQSRTLLLGGGGLFQDSTSIRSCLYYWGIVRMAVLTGCIPWAFGQSIGPLKSRAASFFARDALSLCRVRCVRDEGSLDWLKANGMEGKIAPDTVLALSDRLDLRGGDRDHLLVNIRPWPGPLPAAAASAARILGARNGLPLMGVALSDEDLEVMNRLSGDGLFSPVAIRRVRTLDDVVETWRSGSETFGMRLHFCVISAMTGMPCVAVPYDPKVSGFASRWGLHVWSGEGPLPQTDTCSGTKEKVIESSAIIEESFAEMLGTVFGGE